MSSLDSATAARFARIALGHVRQEYPHKLDHVLLNDSDARPPRSLHPIFFGSFDWHSCVHGWWTLLTVRRLFPELAKAAGITALADDSFTAGKVAAELAYLDRPLSGGFERPYGWAWLLALHQEASRHEDRPWAEALEPLARAFAERLRLYLTVLTYPIRTGTHFNTAFALVLAQDWAERFDPSLAGAITERAWTWFGGDRDCQAWEPSGDDFLSAALCEALCILRTNPDRFGDWFAAFLPRLAGGEPRTLFEPAHVSDRSDGKIAHLDGLNLSRAWCWRHLGAAVGGEAGTRLLQTADAHQLAAMPHINGDYAGEHWLATFALLASLATI
ncbi:DUF2891 domain-containing protein [Sphingomonas sp. BN140010]|uniref:DUF2891 domain-containing protein n=1 Tax=Sphingomonas arvum TaxID=2992113 RepID=A0ABT3JHC7_9SPHN|nr:DUF2891 domain-containing protein [Sphingomonas sp. BN140010]MCW3798487.1 DUF2891 domain-containing protein [Sphingomonas sp. BN140010]